MSLRYRTLLSYLIILICAFFPTSVYSQSTLPGYQTLSQRLENQINLIVNAGGYLRPAYLNQHEHFAAKIYGPYDHMAPYADHYWSNPAETVYTLIRALPFLSPTLAQQTRQYIESYWNTYQPWQYTHTGWDDPNLTNDGLPREAYDTDPTYSWAAEYRRSRTSRGSAAWTTDWNGSTTTIYTFNPLNIYAGWMYAKTFGNAASILTQFTPRIQAPPPDSLMLDKPHIMNLFLAGYYGYLELQSLAGLAPNSQVQGWFDHVLSLRLQHLTQAAANPAGIRGVEAGGFLYIMPEIGDLLAQNTQAVQNTQTIINDDNANRSYWFVSRVDEVTRIASNIETGEHQEGSTAVYYDYSSPFNARALILKQTQGELGPYLDIPAVSRGDLFHIQNLVAAIAAPTDPNATPEPTNPPVTPSPSPTVIPSAPGDANSDGKVDGQDYTIWLIYYNPEPVVMGGASQGDFTGDHRVDGQDYTLWLIAYNP